jgi:cyclic pyranopterin phosphate synthase
MEKLVDGYGRETTDLRVSVTDRCNFRCVYCHNEGQGPVKAASAAHAYELTPEEIRDIVEVAHGFGVTHVKLSGGEPLVRSDIAEIIRLLAPMVEVSMVTNGSMLEARAVELKAAGLTRLNISMDSLDPAEFATIRRGSLKPVLRGIARSLEVGIRPVKVNMVVFKGTVEHVPEMIQYIGETEGLKLQLIEFMPELVGLEELMVDIDEVKDALERRADRVEIRDMHHRRIYHIGGAEVEVVDPVENEEFCFNCRRLRVTADGHLKGCLNRNDDLVSLRGLDRAGMEDAFRRVVANRVPYYGAYLKPPYQNVRHAGKDPLISVSR